MKDQQLNYQLKQFENQVLSGTGDHVSIEAKSKGVTKFGTNPNVGTTRVTISSIGSNETFITTNAIDKIVSTDAADTEVVRIEGHTVSGTGVDAVFTFVVQTVTLTGLTPATLSTPLARVNRAYVDDSFDLTGTVYVYEDSTITAGVPDDLTKAHIIVVQEANQSEKAATTISDQDYWAITSVSGSVNEKQAANVDLFLEIREVGKVFREVFRFSVSNRSGAVVVPLDPAIIVHKNSDVRLTAVSSNANTSVSGFMAGYLAKIMPSA